MPDLTESDIYRNVLLSETETMKKFKQALNTQTQSTHAHQQYCQKHQKLDTFETAFSAAEFTEVRDL